jgi:hypothetical protein
MSRSSHLRLTIPCGTSLQPRRSHGVVAVGKRMKGLGAPAQSTATLETYGGRPICITLPSADASYRWERSIRDNRAHLIFAPPPTPFRHRRSLNEINLVDHSAPNTDASHPALTVSSPSRKVAASGLHVSADQPMNGPVTPTSGRCLDAPDDTQRLTAPLAVATNAAVVRNAGNKPRAGTRTPLPSWLRVQQT